MTLNLVRRLVKGTALTAAEHDANLSTLETAIEAPLVRAQLSRITPGTTTITTQNTYITTGLAATLDSSTAYGMTRGTTDTFGLKNTSGSTRLMHIYVQLDVSNGNNHEIGIKLAKNGAVINETEQRVVTGSGGHDVGLATSWLVSMANNDEVSLFIANITSPVNIQLSRGRFIAVEIR